jgi:hypothetical protein
VYSLPNVVNWLTPWNRVLLKRLTFTQLVKKFPLFMEPEASLQCSQQPARGPYPDPDVCSPHVPPYCHKIYVNIIFLSSFTFPDHILSLPWYILYKPCEPYAAFGGDVIVEWSTNCIVIRTNLLAPFVQGRSFASKPSLTDSFKTLKIYIVPM